MTIANKNHYTGVPKLHVSRSRFRPEHVETKTTWNNGDLIPLRVLEAYPGDTFNINVNSFIRELTLLNPVMDDLYMNVWAFFVPNRLVLSSWKEVLGVNTDGAWLPQTEVSVPYATIPKEVDHIPGTLWDYFQAIGGITTVNSNKVQLLKLRGYYKIWNDHFRFQPVQVPALEDTSASNKTVTGIITPLAGGTTYSISSYTSGQAFRDAIEAAVPNWKPQSDNTGLYPLHVCRIADYWSTCLPTPVAESVQIPGIITDTVDSNGTGLYLSTEDGDPIAVSVDTAVYTGHAITDFDRLTDSTSDNHGAASLLVGDASKATIASLRQAIALTHFLENDALYGFKNEKSIILGHYGVDNGDARVQLSEYLGGFSFILHQSQVAQTSATGATGTAQGNLAAYTQQFNSSHLCRYSATEHGYLFILGATRTNRSYSQGVDPSMLRLDKFDFYWPEFANISDSPVYLSTIYYEGGDPKAHVFGYQEPFADLRWLGGSQVSAYMRPSFTNSFESFSYADEYASVPSLSDRWICETAANVDRTLAVSSRLTHQFLGDFYFDIDVYRPMPVYGKPGLLRI